MNNWVNSALLQLDPDRLSKATWNTIRYLFLASAVFSVLNISISGNSFYFYLILPFFDLPFLKWLSEKKWKSSTLAWIFLTTIFLFVQIFHGSAAKYIIKPFWVAIVVSYSIFLLLNHPVVFRKIYVFCSISVVFGLIQLWSVFAQLQHYFYPTSIGRMIWGPWAIVARPGFEDGIIFPIRVAGLSKEPGFFSSLLLVIFILLQKDRQVSSRTKKWLTAFILTGIILSFSKITLAIIAPALVIYFAKKAFPPIDKVPLFGLVALYFAGMIALTRLAYESFGLISASYVAPYFIETYLHRTIGYYLLNKTESDTIANLILYGGATQSLSEVLNIVPFLSNLHFVKSMPDVVFFSSCLAYILIQYSALFLIGYLGILRSFRVQAMEFLVFVLIVSSVNPLAFENFVVLGYLLLIPNSERVRHCRPTALTPTPSY